MVVTYAGYHEREDKSSAHEIDGLEGYGERFIVYDFSSGACTFRTQMRFIGLLEVIMINR